MLPPYQEFSKAINKSYLMSYHGHKAVCLYVFTCTCVSMESIFIEAVLWQKHKQLLFPVKGNWQLCVL